MAAVVLMLVASVGLAAALVWRRRSRPDPLIQERFARYCMR